MIKPALIFVALFVFLTGCVPSVNPLYTEQDLIFDGEILGAWTDDDQSETWEFTYPEEKAYRLVHTDEHGKRGEFEARLVKIEGKTFLDVAPVRSQLSQNDFANGHFLSLHSFVLVTLERRTLRLSYLDPKWLKTFLEKNPTAVRHTTVDGEILFTDSSKNLQKFIAVNINTPGAFSAAATVRRKEAAK